MSSSFSIFPFFWFPFLLFFFSIKDKEIEKEETINFFLNRQESFGEGISLKIIFILLIDFIWGFFIKI